MRNRDRLWQEKRKKPNRENDKDIKGKTELKRQNQKGRMKDIPRKRKKESVRQRREENVTERKQCRILFGIHIICRGNCTAKVHMDVNRHFFELSFNSIQRIFFFKNTVTISK